MITSPSRWAITIIYWRQVLHIPCFAWSRPAKGRITLSCYTPRPRWRLLAHPGILGSHLLVASGGSIFSAVSESTNVRQNVQQFVLLKYMRWEAYTQVPLSLLFSRRCNGTLPTLRRTRIRCSPSAAVGYPFSCEKPRMVGLGAHPLVPWHCHIMCKIKNMRICYVIKKHVIGFTYSFSTAHRGSTQESGFILESHTSIHGG